MSTDEDTFTTLYLNPSARDRFDDFAYASAFEKEIGAEIALGLGDFINVFSKNEVVIARAVLTIGTSNVVEYEI